MLTKEQIAWIIIKPFQGGVVNTFREIDPRDIYPIIDNVRNAIMESIVAEFGDLDGEFVTPYKKVPILCDEYTGEKYSVLPADIISFGDYLGIRQVSPMKNQKMSLIKMDNGAENTHAPLESGKLHGNAGYYLQRDPVAKKMHIRYVNLPSNFDSMLIKMIASVKDFEEDEPLPIPAKYEHQLIETVGQTFDKTFKIPQDTKSDVAPNINE